MSWRIQLLGGFGVWCGGEAVPMPPALRQLVAFLALHGPRDRSRTACALWPAMPEERALADLRTAAWRLHRVAPGLLRRSPGALALTEGADVDALQPLRGRCPGGPDGTGSPCDELLPGWFDDWVLIAREQVRHRMIRALEDAARTAICAGDPRAGLAWAMRAVSADPLRESSHRLVVDALLQEGDVDAARHHAGLVTDLLRDELGVQPSDQLSVLIRRAWEARPAPR